MTNKYPYSVLGILLFGLLFLCSLHSTAQSFYDQNTYIPPSPNASSVVKQANTPVNLHTGTLQVSIPLFTLKGRDLAVPVNLSYQASGIKVQDISGPVGLGWALNAGGVVTRVVRGLPDEKTNGYCGTNKIGKKWEQPLTWDNLEKVKDGDWDGEPDVFYFNFLGKSGSFVLDADKNPLFIPHQNIRVEKNGLTGYPKEWILVDENGTKYHFGSSSYSREETESKIAAQPDSKKQTYTSSWFLSKIVSASGDIITFSYKYGDELSYKYYKSRQSDLVYFNKSGICWGPSPQEETVTDESIILKINHSKYLSSIKSSAGEIKFTVEAGRQDLGGWYYYSKIALYNLNSSEPVREFFLDYDYFENEDCNSECKRLYLKSIWNGQGCDMLPYYRFGYNIDENLPSRRSSKTDHWGYYNNNTSGTSIPAGNYKGEYLPGANKNTDSEKVKANVLTKMYLPSGGFKAFEYEPHTYQNNGTNKLTGGTRVKKTTESTGEDSQNDIVTTYSYNEEGNQLSSGKILRFPKYSGDYFFSYSGQGIACKETLTYYFRTSQSLNDLFDLGGTHIGYGTVSVLRSDGAKTVYNFTNFDDQPDTAPQQFMFKKGEGYYGSTDKDGSPFASYSSNAFKRGLPKMVRVYKKNQQLVQRTTYEYEFNLLQEKTLSCLRVTVGHHEDQKIGEELYSVGRYTMISGLSFLTKQTEKLFDENDNVTEKTVEFFYDNPEKTAVSKTISKQSDGSELITKLKYPYDYSDGGNDEPSIAVGVMKENHIDAAVIEKSIFLKKTGSNQEKLLASSLTLFKEIEPEIIVPFKTKIFESTVLPTDFQASKIADGNFVYDDRYRSILTFNKYNQFFKSTEVTNDAKIKKSVVLSNDGTQVLARAELAGTDQTAFTSFEDNSNDLEGNWNYSNGTQPENGFSGERAFSGTVKFDNQGNQLPDGNYRVTLWVEGDGIISVNGQEKPVNGDWKYLEWQTESPGTVTVTTAGTTIDELRLYPADASMQTFTYKPLVGITSKSDETGRIIRYEYDEQNRLKHIRDFEDNIIESYNYYDKRKSALLNPLFTASKQTEYTYKSIEFKAQDQCSQGVFYQWDFGDGQIVEGGDSKVSHQYTEIGKYTVSLTVAKEGLETQKSIKPVEIFEVQCNEPEYKNINGQCVKGVLTCIYCEPLAQNKWLCGYAYYFAQDNSYQFSHQKTKNSPDCQY